MTDQVDATTGRDDGVSSAPSLDDADMQFRVVVHRSTRRGIKLEHFFWMALKRVAQSQKTTIGHTVEQIAQTVPEGKNLTSAIRVACARWQATENSELRQVASLGGVNAILSACPSPVFALSSSKHILSFNKGFQQLVRRQLPTAPLESEQNSLKLSLDLEIAEVFKRLARQEDQPLATGFTIDVSDRRYRGRVNIIRAPATEVEILLGFVSAG